MLEPSEIENLKREHPIEKVISAYGIPLRPVGRALVGRCPFHDDGGRPNLFAYPTSQSWYCYRCALGGDVISFVERIERIGFRAAVARLGDDRDSIGGQTRTLHDQRRRPKARSTCGPAERACLSAAVEFYHNCLLADQRALAYVEARGLNHDTLTLCRVGYANGGELAAYLRWRRLPIGAALRAGLLTRAGQEFFAGRVVVPEIRAGQPIWLIGRTLQSGVDEPKYLGLRGPKPLLGWETALRERSVYLGEGVFDWLTLRQWRLPALALDGTHPRAAVLRALARFERLYLVLDNDAAGRRATAEMSQALGPRAIPIFLPAVKDVAELAPLPNGRASFLQAVEEQRNPLAA